MDKSIRASLRSWLMSNYGGTPAHEVKEILDDLEEVIEAYGLVPASAGDDDWEPDESDEN